MALVYPVLFGYSRSLGTLIASTIPLFGIFGYALNATIFAQEQGSLARAIRGTCSSCRSIAAPWFSGRSSLGRSWPFVLLFDRAVFYPFERAGDSGRDPVACARRGRVMVSAFAWMPLRRRVIRAVIGSFATLALGAIPVWIIRSDPEASTLLTSVLLVYFGGCAHWHSPHSRQSGGVINGIFGSRERASRPSGARRLARLRSARPFASSAKAQFAYEWRCHGLVVVGFLCGTMVMIWAVLLSAGKPVQAPLFPLILGLLLAAPLSSVGSMGPALSRLRPFWIDHRESNTFLTVRPMESAGFVIAKMRMAALTVFLSWVFILSGTALCFTLSRSLPAAISTWHRFASHYPGGRAPAICVLVCLLLPVVTWRLLTDGLPFVLTGKKWIADGAVWLYLAALITLISGGLWLGNHPDQLPRVFAIAPWIVVVVAVLKAAAATAAFRAALRRKVMGWRQRSGKFSRPGRVSPAWPSRWRCSLAPPRASRQRPPFSSASQASCLSSAFPWQHSHSIGTGIDSALASVSTRFARLFGLPPFTRQGKIPEAIAARTCDGSRSTRRTRQ